MAPETAVAIALVVALATSVQGTLGFGFAMVFAPLAALVVDVDEAIAVSILAGAVAAMSQYADSRPRAPLPSVVPLAAGALAGIPVGLLLLSVTPDTALRLLVGVAVLASAMITLARRSHHPVRQEEPLPWAIGAGVAGGVTLGAVSMNGPPVLLYLHWQGGQAATIRARMHAFLAFSSLPGVIIAIGLGVIDGRVVELALAGFPGLLVGGLLARRLRPRLTEEWFARASMAVLALTSAVAIAGAVAALV